jgi:lipoprotein-anchoring transpeptidase ErfK/SrfK
MRAVAALAAAALLAGCGAGDRPERSDRETVRGAAAPAAKDQQRLPFTGGGSGDGPVRPVDSAAQADGDASAPQAARIVRKTVLRSRPGGRAVVQVPRRTPFGSKQILAVVERRDGWLAVLHPSMPNGRAGWIPARAARLSTVPMAIEVDLSERLARLRVRGRVVDLFRVGVGRPGSPTPTGRVAVTHRLLAGSGLPYGCCILALSGRQPNLPSGWNGGDRLALHGVADQPRVGRATSAGCLHVRERDLRTLIRRVRAGTRVTISA